MLRFFKKDQSTEIPQLSEISECDACGACNEKFPSSLKIDSSTPLYKSTSNFDLHCVVPSGKSDWPHDATATKGSVEASLVSWGSSSGHTVKVSVVHWPIPENCSPKKNDILLLPYFVWIKSCDASQVSSVVPRVVEAVSKQNLKEIELLSKQGVIEKANDKAYMLLCSHKTRDKRCGITAGIMKREFESHLRDMDLLRDFGDDRPGGVQIGLINHVGGHKFAANLIIYRENQEMVWLARLTPANCGPILEETVLQGKVWPDQVRLIQKQKNGDFTW